jgi:tRNA (guanosine-2'-O-)-methyltransferase
MDFGEIDHWIARASAESAVRALDPYLTEARKQRIEQVLSGRLSSIQVAVERPDDPHNAAAIVRSAEALGAMHVHVVDAPPGALHAQATTQGAYCWVHTHHHADLQDLLAATQERGVRLAGALMEGALAVHELPVDRPLCVLFGNEGTGLSQAALSACDLTFRIPMYGMSESMNLSVSAAITLHTVTRKRREFLGRDGDLEGSALVQERARYYARSVDRRLLEGLWGA